MRKLALLTIAGFIAVTSFYSCKKDYKCTCTFAGISGDTTYTKVSKSDAQKKCDSDGAPVVALGGSCSVSAK